MSTVPVTQADRDAAGGLVASTEWSVHQFTSGKRDKHAAVQAFAKHRIASQADLLEALTGLVGDTPIPINAPDDCYFACDSLTDYTITIGQIRKARAAISKASSSIYIGEGM